MNLLQTSSTIGGAILQNLSLKGSSSMTLMSCFAKSIQPNSPGFRDRCHDTQVTGLGQPPGFCLTTYLGQTNPAAERAISSSVQPSSYSAGYSISHPISPECCGLVLLGGPHLQQPLG